jgi:hypothetical protein
MAKFPRPAGAIESYKDIKVGDCLWHLYGIWMPSVSSCPVIITSAPVRFGDSPSYAPIHKGQKDEVIFAYRYLDWPEDRGIEAFAGDGNLNPGQSHNDNYWFRSFEEAEAGRKFLLDQWKARPDLIEAAEEQRRFDRETDLIWDREAFPEYHE